MPYFPSNHVVFVSYIFTATPSPAAPAASSTLRLVGGANPFEGRLEILHNGAWGTVCDDYFTASDGNVACAQLGFGESLSIVTDDSFGVGKCTIHTLIIISP